MKNLDFVKLLLIYVLILTSSCKISNKTNSITENNYKILTVDLKELTKNKYEHIVKNIYLRKNQAGECIVYKFKNREKEYKDNFILIKKETNNDSIVKINVFNNLKINNSKYVDSSIITYKLKDSTSFNSYTGVGLVNFDFKRLNINDFLIKFNLKEPVGVNLFFETKQLNNHFSFSIIDILIYSNGDYDLYILPIEFNKCNSNNYIRLDKLDTVKLLQPRFMRESFMWKY